MSVIPIPIQLPTLDEWGLITLALIIGFAALDIFSARNSKRIVRIGGSAAAVW